MVTDPPQGRAAARAKTLRMLERRLDRANVYLPRLLAEWLTHLRHPSASWVRVPLGILLIIGGCLSFLPILGIWMLPLGFVFLSLDIVLLRRPTARMLVSGERWWKRWRRNRRSR